MITRVSEKVIPIIPELIIQSQTIDSSDPKRLEWKMFRQT